MGRKTRAGKIPANRNYKDTVFRMLFKDKGRLLGLYNAVSGRSSIKNQKEGIFVWKKLRASP